LSISTAAYGEDTRYVMAILPCSDVVMTFKKFTPMINFLKQQAGIDIEVKVPKDFSELEAGIIKGKIDFVLQDPHTYVRLAPLLNKDNLLKVLNQEGENIQRAAVVVRKDSGITNLHDLKGKTVMFGPKLSLTKWLAAKKLFQDNGMDIDKDLKAYYYGGCCEDITFNVYLKVVDAGVICHHCFCSHGHQQIELGIEKQQLVVIGKTEGFPMRVFASRKGLPDDIAARVSLALLKLDMHNPEYADILHSAELGGFRRTSDSDYNLVRTFVGVGRQE